MLIMIVVARLGKILDSWLQKSVQDRKCGIKWPEQKAKTEPSHHHLQKFLSHRSGCNKTLQLISQNAAQPGRQLCQMILLARRTKVEKQQPTIPRNFQKKTSHKERKKNRTQIDKPGGKCKKKH